MKKRALLISFEGIEGSGKSTQCRNLCAHLESRGIRVALFREPGSSSVGEKIREILLHGQTPLSGLCTTFLFLAARVQLMQEKVMPALATADVVVLDRFIDATVAYQGYGEKIDRRVIDTLNKIAVAGFFPDLTILLDVPATVGIERCGKGDRFERRPLVFHRRVRQGYLAVAKQYPQRICVLKAHQPIAAVEQQVRSVVEEFLRRRRIA